MDHRDFISEARDKAEQDQRDLARDIETDRTARFFSRDTSTWSDLFEGLFLTTLIAIVPFLAFAGLALWSFNSLGKDSSVHWVFVFFALAIPVLVLYRALKSKSDVPASVLADMIGGFWTGVFPFLLIGGLAVFGLAAWLGVPVQVALGILIIGGILIAAMANQ